MCHLPVSGCAQPFFGRAVERAVHEHGRRDLHAAAPELWRGQGCVRGPVGRVLHLQERVDVALHARLTSPGAVWKRSHQVKAQEARVR